MDTKNKFELFLPGISSEANDQISLIAADLREEKTVIGLYATENRKIFLKVEKLYPTKEFNSFSAIVNQFIADHSLEGISKIAIGVPGPVIGGKSEPARLPWKLDTDEIKNATQINEVFLINDLEASAYGLEQVSEENLVKIHDSGNFTPGNAVLLAPGDGLGEAALFWDGSYFSKKSCQYFAYDSGKSKRGLRSSFPASHRTD